MQQFKFLTRLEPFLLATCALILFIPFLGNVHLFDWDEINFAEIAREMVVTHNYIEPQINFQFFTEKPPLFFWLQAVCMEVFGVNEFSARLPNALLAVLVLPVLYSIGKKLKDRTLGWLWALISIGMILPHLYFKSGIIDPWFNFFTFLSLYFLILASESKRQQRSNLVLLMCGGILLGLSILTKGPVAAIVLGITCVIYRMLKSKDAFITFSQFLVYAMACLLTVGIWLSLNYFHSGDTFIKEFTIRQWELLTTQDAGHGGFFLYHWVVLFFGCFPATAFFIEALINKKKRGITYANFDRWMVILFWVVLILFTIVKTKIVHYSSLSYYPISFLAALSAYHMIKREWIITKRVFVMIVLSALPFILAPFAFAYFGQHIAQLRPFLKQDPFAVENLQAQVYWSGWEFTPGLLLVLVIFTSFKAFNGQKITRALLILFGGTVLYSQLLLYFLIGRIEAYSQRANIEFWKAHASENCHMISYGYKTYTYYFYGEVKKQANVQSTDDHWLLNGAVDNPVYISCRVNKKEQFEKEIKDATFLYNRNGFYFYRREVKAR